MNKVKPYRITIHCSDSANGVAVSKEEITKWHMLRGFRTIGYHLVINPSDYYYGRSYDELGAHVRLANTGNIGICMVGRDRFTYRQFQMLHDHLDQIRLSYGIPYQNIFCHYQFPTAQKDGKTCPNMSINDLLAWYILGDYRIIDPYVLK